MPAQKSAQDRMIEYFVGAELGEAQQTLKTAGVILRARQARSGKKPVMGGEAGEALKRKPGRPKKADKPVTGAMPPGARPVAPVEE